MCENFIEPIKTPEAKLTLGESPISTKQLIKILERTPAQHIYRRPAKGGGQWDYVTGTYVKKILNYVFSWMWDFEIKEHGREDNLVWILGRLTIKNTEREVLVVKEQFGRADIKFKRNSQKPLDYGNDLKAATTDALKKCAAELGIASDIYGKNEFRDITKQKSTKKSKKATQASTNYKKRLLDKLYELGAKTAEEAAEELSGRIGTEVKNINKISEATAQQYYAELLNSPSLNK